MIPAAIASRYVADRPAAAVGAKGPRIGMPRMHRCRACVYSSLLWAS